MKHLPVVLLLAIWLLRCATPSQAAPLYKERDLMIATSDVVALVTITATEVTQSADPLHYYHQKATAHLDVILKNGGEVLPEQLTLWGDGSFRCGRCHFEVGRSLVFLHRQDGIYTGSNLQDSVRSISGVGENAMVPWASQNTIGDGDPMPLKDVVDSIRGTIDAQSNAPHYALDLKFALKGQPRLLKFAAVPDAAFKNLKAPTLLATLYRLPLGSTIDYNPTCVIQSSEPTPTEIEQFRQTCQERGLKFAFAPTG